MEIKQILLCTSVMFGTSIFSQTWQTGGNNLTAPQPVNTTNNFLGTGNISQVNNTPLKIGVNYSQDIFIDNDPTQLYPADASGRLHGGHWVGLGRSFTPSTGIGSTPWFHPMAHLHIDGGNNSGQWGSFGSGMRSWFNTGTVYTENSDGMYVGLRSMGPNFSYAVINWSDDAYGGPGGSDFLSFNFTGGPNALAGSVNGVELGRFNPTQARGTLGIGNYQIMGTSTDPVRRLEILDADPTTGANSNAPQLRTTYTYNATPTGGVFTEFQTTSLGDMYFNTRSNGNARRFGFHDNTPGNTVEITSQPGVPYFGLANGSSGLRFTNLTNLNTPIVNPGNKVLSVDNFGNVILVPGGLSSSNNGVYYDFTAGAFQLGAPCSNLADVIANGLTTSRMVYLANNNMWFANGNFETGGVGVGGQPTPGGICNVGNTFEISANSKNPQYGSNDASGLRFSKLTASSPALSNGTNGVDATKVLTVDGDGDVVLVNASGVVNADNGLSTNGPNAGAIHLGQSYGAAGNPGQLLDNREIPFNGFNIFFNGNNPVGTSRILIGQQPATTNLQAKLYSYNNAETNGIYSEMDGDNTGAFDTDLAIRTSGGLRMKNAIHGNIHSTNTGPGACVGVFGESSSEYTAIGVVGYASSNSAITYGVLGRTAGTGNNSYGGSFSAIGNTSNSNYGIYADASGATVNNYAGYFNGDVYISGSYGPSDQNLKDNIDSISNALSIIKQLKPRSFAFKHNDYPSMHLPSGTQYGLIAQDVETILPALVTNNTHPAQLDAAGNTVVPSVNFKGLEYQQLIPFLIKAMQEQQAKIDSLTTKLNSKDSLQDARLTALENAITQCCQNATARNSNPSINQLDVELSDKDAIVLNQNVPNPFAEQTSITYHVPESVGKAQLLFYNTNGALIQTVDIKTRGKGKINVFASDLSSGLYHYTLVADGKVVDSKKMVRE